MESKKPWTGRLRAVEDAGCLLPPFGNPMTPTMVLQDSAVLALKNISARLDRALDFQPYFKVELDPPRAVHESWDYCDMTGRYVDSMALIRQVTGLSAPREEEAG